MNKHAAHLVYCVVALLCAATMTLIACFSDAASGTITPLLLALGLIMGGVAVGQHVDRRRRGR